MISSHVETSLIPLTINFSHKGYLEVQVMCRAIYRGCMNMIVIVTVMAQKSSECYKLPKFIVMHDVFVFFNYDF